MGSTPAVRLLYVCLCVCVLMVELCVRHGACDQCDGMRGRYSFVGLSPCRPRPHPRRRYTQTLTSAQAVPGVLNNIGEDAKKIANQICQ